AVLSTTQEVLVEGQKDDPDGQAVLTGRTRTNKLVHFRAPPVNGHAPPALGELVDVRIEKTSPWSLQGSLVSAVECATPQPEGCGIQAPAFRRG
ncbi:MAG TPA: TRAM domain-containing protein, partial [Dehalococcoidia bacterium]|nr:TRAM domain-containing protein [Dehalococcoidia bacterium]